MAREDGPYTVQRGHVTTDRHILTHVEWHPSSWFGDFGQPETGVRWRDDPGAFELIQHGWWDFEKAEAIILRGLAKGWDTYRISRLMEWMRERRRP